MYAKTSGFKKLNGIWVRGVKHRRPKIKKPTSPSRREAPWVSITIRAEHYAMLRELSELYKCSVGRVVMTLVQEEFIRHVAQTDPEKARQLEEEYADL